MSNQRPDSCPVCGATWLAEEIPPESRHHYAGATHYRRTICIYDCIMDMGILYACPDCESIFERRTHTFVPGAKLKDF
jgi:hypothetical protein